MSSSRPASSPSLSYAKSEIRRPPFHSRDGLGAYIASPASYPSSRVITYSDAFVTIHDLFPKSSIHLLLLPRDPSKTLLHPFLALSDSAFLAQIQFEVQELKLLVAKELKRRFGAGSELEKRREEALENGKEGVGGAEGGRDWNQDVLVGVHAHPSMNHLHIHIISRDFYSEAMRHRKHYNSFHTGFFVDVEEFPLKDGDPRWHPGREKYLEEDLRCWRCGKNFGNKFATLKRHLEGEFEAWKRV